MTEQDFHAKVMDLLRDMEEQRQDLAEHLAALPRIPLPGNPGQQHSEAAARAERESLKADIAALDKLIGEAKEALEGFELSKAVDELKDILEKASGEDPSVSGGRTFPTLKTGKAR